MSLFDGKGIRSISKILFFGYELIRWIRNILKFILFSQSLLSEPPLVHLNYVYIVLISSTNLSSLVAYSTVPSMVSFHDGQSSV